MTTSFQKLILDINELLILFWRRKTENEEDVVDVLTRNLLLHQEALNLLPDSSVRSSV